MKLGVALAVAGVAVLGGAFATGLWQIPVILIMNQMDTTAFRVDGSRLVMNGEINSKTLDQFEAVIADHPQITTLFEGHVPGSLDDDTMIALAYRVRDLGLKTELGAESEIYSGGVDLFLAGVERRATEGAVIGVHSWSDGMKDAIEYPRDAPEHEANRAYVEAMLGDDAFYWYTIEAAPAAGIHIMTREEIEKYGLLTEPMRKAQTGE
ncbi:alpha/beta hydrolase [Aliiroseovarius crassostreae]|uniref:alpha/beta hydrolase n=1 Tax=Aliiroseovarius crassostreae TaxID=154981 RepID=UPI003C7DB912